MYFLRGIGHIFSIYCCCLPCIAIRSGKLQLYLSYLLYYGFEKSLFLPEQIGTFFDCDSVHYKLTDKMTSYDFRRDINLLTRKETTVPSKCMIDLLFLPAAIAVRSSNGPSCCCCC